MKNKLFNMLGIVALGLMGLTAGSAHAQTTAAGPYYPYPSWDQKLQCDTQATCPRFVVLSNWDSAAVLDRDTGLVWEKSPSTNLFTWVNAQAHCNGIIVGGRLGWRLPTIQELASLAGSGGPALPAGHPFSANLDDFTWSSTLVVDNPNAAWIFGEGVGTGLKTNTSVAWCVRGVRGRDAQ